MPEIDSALERGVRFLLDRQCPDGAWRSDTYGVFKEGDALTSLVLSSLGDSGCAEVEPALLLGLDYLASFVRPDGRIDEGQFGLTYPVYTAALAVPVLARPPATRARGHRETASLSWGSQRAHDAGDAWLAFLRERQLTEELGWERDDPHFGGWGYCHGLPRKPAPGETPAAYTESNLSATAAALEALLVIRRWTSSQPALCRARVFVERCQNFTDYLTERDADFDDGGFFFVQGDPQRNKAGSPGVDRHGRQRFASYGSMTADGLRCLLLCGAAPDEPRVQAALGWLARCFTAAHNPGCFPKARTGVQASVYFYWCWSLARTLSHEFLDGVPMLGLEGWQEALAEELSQRQRPDGSWSNGAVEVREDDPIVATALAVGALAHCTSPSWPAH